jgi:hypothetical protein
MSGSWGRGTLGFLFELVHVRGVCLQLRESSGKRLEIRFCGSEAWTELQPLFAADLERFEVVGIACDPDVTSLSDSR